MERIIDRLDKYMEFKGLNPNIVTNECGLSVGLINQARKGKSDIGKKSADKILRKYQDINRIWFLTGEGEMISNSAALADASDENAVWLPVINLDTRGGLLPNNETDIQQYNTAQMPFSRNIARDGDFVMPVVGDSMTPKYPNGTYVLVRPLPTWREYIELGATYVLELIDGRRVIKDVRAGDDKEHFRLYSVNPTFDPTEIAKSFISHIFAVIVAVRRELNW